MHSTTAAHAGHRSKSGANIDRAKLTMLSDTRLAEKIAAVQRLLVGANSMQPDLREAVQAAIDEIGNFTLTDYAKVLKLLRGEQRRRDHDRKMIRYTIPWTPFEEQHVDPAQLFTPEAEQRFKALVAAEGKGQDWRRMREIYIAGLLRRKCYVNSRYQVEAETDGCGMVHLSIKRLDQQPVHDWRDLQRIKSELVGPECEALELYPAESRVVDTANQYHLWVVADPEHRFEIGWNEGRLVMDDGEAQGVGQRSFGS